MSILDIDAIKIGISDDNTTITIKYTKGDKISNATWRSLKPTIISGLDFLFTCNNCDVPTKWICPNCGYITSDWTMRDVQVRGAPVCPNGVGADGEYRECGADMQLDITY